MKPTVKVSVELMQKIVNYLEGKPHKEVAQLIMEIVTECNAKEPEPEPVTLPVEEA